MDKKFFAIISVPHQQVLIDEKCTHGGVLYKKPHRDRNQKIENSCPDTSGVNS